MKTDTAGLTQRLSAAKRTVETTEARKRAARTAREKEMLEGILDRARRALAQATREIEEDAHG